MSLNEGLFKEIPNEFDDQCAIFKWAKLSEGKYPCLKYMFSTLNGVRLTMKQAVNAKKSGNKKGVPDIVLPFPNHGYHGLYIELKRTKGGTVSPEQKDFIKYLNEVGYKALVAKGHSEAIEQLKSYLGENHERITS